MAATPLPPQLNIVRSGLKYSAEAAEKARQKGQFLRVGGKAVTKRYLSGAGRSWARTTEPDEYNTIFVPGFRITGTPAHIQEALESANYGLDQIQQAFNTAITRDNWNNTMAGAYEAEIESRKALQTAKPAVEGYDWPQIKWFAQHRKEAVIASKGEQRAATSSPGRARAGESIGDKLRKLSAEKVLDVSNMDLTTGKGYRTTDRPKTSKAGKFGDFRRGVKIISNNIDSYIRALQLAFGANAEADYAPEIAFVRQQLSGRPSLAVAPAPFATRASPPIPVGASLAPAPVFAPAVPSVASPTIGNIGGAGLPALPSLAQLPGLPRL